MRKITGRRRVGRPAGQLWLRVLAQRLERMPERRLQRAAVAAFKRVAVAAFKRRLRLKEKKQKKIY